MYDMKRLEDEIHHETPNPEVDGCVVLVILREYTYNNNDNFYVALDSYTVEKCFEKKLDSYIYAFEKTKNLIKEMNTLIRILLESELFIFEENCIRLSDIIHPLGLSEYIPKRDEFDEPCEEWVLSYVLPILKKKNMREVDEKIIEELAFFFVGSLFYLKSVPVVGFDEVYAKRESVKLEIQQLEVEKAALRESIESMRALF